MIHRRFMSVGQHCGKLDSHYTEEEEANLIQDCGICTW